MDIDQKAATWAERRFGLIRADAAARMGFTRHQINQRVKLERWIPVRRGVWRIHGVPASWDQEILAATWTSGCGAVASGASAMRIWRLDRGDQLELTTPRDHQLRIPGVVCHRAMSLPDQDHTRRGPIPVTSVARTLVDMSGRLGIDELGSAIDLALRTRILKLRDLEHCVARLRPATGRRLSIVRAALDLRVPGYDPGDSDLETRAVRAIIHRGLPAPRRRYTVRIDGRKYVLDLAYPDVLVAIEVDGWEIHGTRSPFDYDRRRSNAFVAHGWSLLRFTSTMSDEEFGDRTAAALEIARQRVGA